AGLDHAEALDLEPLAQLEDLGRAADAVGALDHDQLALERGRVDARQAVAEEALAGAPEPQARHGISSARATISRTSACCSGIGRVASTGTSPNSSTMLSYCSMTRPWNRRKLCSRSGDRRRSMP